MIDANTKYIPDAHELNLDGDAKRALERVRISLLGFKFGIFMAQRS
jgi:hypothetical protein